MESKIQQNSHCLQKGFTLLEVLVAALVLAISVLGLSGLQLKALRDSTSSYYFSQVTMLGYDIADRIRANNTSNYTASWSDDGTLHAGCSTSAGCTPAQMAESDIFEWKNTIAAVLPSGDGNVSLSGAVYTVAIRWDDSRSGSADKIISMEFQSI